MQNATVSQDDNHVLATSWFVSVSFFTANTKLTDMLAELLIMPNFTFVKEKKNDDNILVAFYLIDDVYERDESE